MPTHRTRSRRTIVAAVMLAALIIGLPACKPGKVGKRCATKEFGDDGGSWVLVCRNGRWQRALTKADAARILFPPTTAAPVTTPPTTLPPLLTYLPSFGEGTHSIGTVMGRDLNIGYYVTSVPPGASCDASTPTSVSRGRGTVRVVALTAYGTSVTASGPCTWSAIPAGVDPTAGFAVSGGTIYVSSSGTLEFPGSATCHLDSISTFDPTMDAYNSYTTGTFGPIVRSLGYWDPSFGTGGHAMTDPRPKLLIASECGAPTPIAWPTSGVNLIDDTGRRMDWLAPNHTTTLIGNTNGFTLAFGGYTATITFLGSGWGSMTVTGCNTTAAGGTMFGGYDTDPTTHVVTKVWGIEISTTCDDGRVESLVGSVG